MSVRITGKQKAIQDLEKAQKLIEEAGKILWKLPSEIQLEITEGNEDATKTGEAPDSLSTSPHSSSIYSDKEKIICQVR